MAILPWLLTSTQIMALGKATSHCWHCWQSHKPSSSRGGLQVTDLNQATLVAAGCQGNHKLGAVQCAHQCAMGRVLEVKCEALAKGCGHLQLQPEHLTVSVLIWASFNKIPLWASLKPQSDPVARRKLLHSMPIWPLAVEQIDHEGQTLILLSDNTARRCWNYTPTHYLVVTHAVWARQLVSASHCAAWRSLRQRLPHRNTHSCGHCAACSQHPHV